MNTYARALALRCLLLTGSLPGLAVTTPACAGSKVQAPAPAVDLSWLEGTWVYEKGESITTERWWRDGTRWRGSSETKRGRETVFTESLVIEAQGPDWVYVASPSGQARTPFALVARGPSTATFENPAHDYPTRIVYTRSGNMLTARIEGLKDGKAASSEWRYVGSDSPPETDR